MDGIALGPPMPPTIACHDILKWTHSVVQENSFVSEWKAIDTAFHLAWEIHGHREAQVASYVSKPRTVVPSPFSVTFCDC